MEEFSLQVSLPDFQAHAPHCFALLSLTCSANWVSRFVLSSICIKQMKGQLLFLLIVSLVSESAICSKVACCVMGNTVEVWTEFSGKKRRTSSLVWAWAREGFTEEMAFELCFKGHGEPNICFPQLTASKFTTGARHQKWMLTDSAKGCF